MKALVLAALHLFARRWPRAGLLVAEAVARLTRPLPRGIADAWIAAAFPELSSEERRTARQQTWVGFLKGEAVEAALTRPGGARGRPPLVPNPALRELRGPLVLAAFHVGPYQALEEALRELPGEVLAIDRGQFAPRAGMTVVPGGENEWERARTFHRALTALRRGGFVLVHVDGAHPEKYAVATVDAPALGRTLPLARGAFALARMSGAPIVPLAARWHGRAVQVTLGEPIAPALDEAGMAAAAAAWIERYLRERPGEASVFMLERLRPPLAR